MENKIHFHAFFITFNIHFFQKRIGKTVKDLCSFIFPHFHVISGLLSMCVECLVYDIYFLRGIL